VAGLAEKADRDKPVNIEADRMTVDDNKQVAVFEGRVVITRGTLQLRGERVTVQQDSTGFQYGVAIGSPATFRQKRDGADGWVEGEAERIEYDGKKEFVEFFNRAMLRREQDEARGNYISYDSKTEFFRVQASKEATERPGQSSRVRAVIQPKNKDKDKDEPKSAPASDPKPAPGIAGPNPK
jgi:lipopolysaccharide export system protein LptA